jgi:hypothetical protein
MRRRTFLTGITGSLSLFAGCGSSSSAPEEGPTNNQTSSQPTESSTQRATTGDTDTTSASAEPTAKRSTNPTPSKQEKAAACNGGIYLDFYALDDGTDGFWDSDTVSVAYGVGPGAHVRLVVFEDDTVLGMNEDFAPENSSLDMDGLTIQLNKKLSGKHTLHAVMYPKIGMTEQFTVDEATPCQYEGEAVQTEPTTIDFSKFSEDTPTP